MATRSSVTFVDLPQNALLSALSPAEAFPSPANPTGADLLTLETFATDVHAEGWCEFWCLANTWEEADVLLGTESAPEHRGLSVSSPG